MENMEHIDSNMKACLATAAASQWLNIRLQFIGVIIVTCVALIAILKKEFDYVDPGNNSILRFSFHDKNDQVHLYFFHLFNIKSSFMYFK